ncbi:alpha/beta fold hydrolase [Cucumibacter marinus]|uniref:alpha/beta fold hydrolase n=1 Tax=Cucumibacter marinus TaxID=1121252 RepID=UPI00040A95E1|nr:alpha/beta hydrolase [Cucumibacter marinus]
MPHLKTHSASVHYDLVGEGPPIIALAGIASDGASWAPLLPYLENRHRMVLVDNRASGQTTDAGGTIDFADYAADALAVMDELGFESADILGHSMGGGIAVQIAARHPERVRRLAIIASAPEVPPKALSLMRTLVQLDETGIDRTVWFKLLYQFLFAPPFFDDPARVETAAASSLKYKHLQSRADFARQVAALTTAAPVDMGAMSMPTLGLAGGADILITPDTMHTAFSRHPDFAFEIIEGAGHAVHWDAPRRVARAVEAFFKD